jgi:hypothetical protein
MIVDTNFKPNHTSSPETPSSTTKPPSPLRLPDIANSIVGLEFIGFTHKTALHIFTTCNKYKEPFSSPSASNYNFFSFIHGYILHINSSKFNGLSECESMSKLGICQAVQDAILDPAFSRVYETKTLGFWIEDTVRIDYMTLLHLRDRGYQEDEDEYRNAGYRPRTE